MEIVLPKEKIKPIFQDPNNLILFGIPKVGKTTIVAQIPNSLILDFEEGSDYVEAAKLKVTSTSHLRDICIQIKKESCPYDFIIIDTVTALEDFAKPLALSLFRNSPQGSKFEGNDVLLAPMGAGYGFLRKAMEQLISMVSSVCKHVILVGHVKDSAISDNLEGTYKELDLLGKTKRVLSAKSDAIGFVYRDEKSNLCISFANNGEISCGARPAHLANKKIIVAEIQEDGTFISHWERIYPSLTQK